MSRLLNAPSQALVNAYAQAFAQKGKGKGLTKEEMLLFFRRYSSNVIDPDFYGLVLTKEKVFHHGLERLHVEDQYRALVDLATHPPVSVNARPSEEDRQSLLNQLHAHGAENGITLRAMSLDSWEIRREWLKATSRIEKNPDAAITTARTLLERACKELIAGEGSPSDSLHEGDLPKLVKAANKAVGRKGGAASVTSGIGSIALGIAERSNAAGDRHATAEPSPPTVAEARFFCDISLALTLYLIEQHQVSVS